LKRRFILTLHH